MVISFDWGVLLTQIQIRQMGRLGCVLYGLAKCNCITCIICIICITYFYYLHHLYYLIYWRSEKHRATFFCLKCKMRNPTICSDAEVLTNSWNCLRTKTNLRHTLVGKQLIKEAGAEGRRELIWNAIFNQCCPYFKKITFVSFVRKDITNTEKVLDLWLIIGLYSLIVQA